MDIWFDTSWFIVVFLKTRVVSRAHKKAAKPGSLQVEVFPGSRVPVMRVDGQDPSFGGSTVSGLGKIHRWIFRLQVTLVVPEPWVTSDSRLVGSLLVAEWWPDSDSESKDFLFARKMRHYFQSNRRPGRSFFRCFMLHASATNNFFIVCW